MKKTITIYKTDLKETLQKISGIQSKSKYFYNISVRPAKNKDMLKIIIG